jgi:hypothetical protein
MEAKLDLKLNQHANKYYSILQTKAKEVYYLGLIDQ